MDTPFLSTLVTLFVVVLMGHWGCDAANEVHMNQANDILKAGGNPGKLVNCGRRFTHAIPIACLGCIVDYLNQVKYYTHFVGFSM